MWVKQKGDLFGSKKRNQNLDAKCYQTTTLALCLFLSLLSPKLASATISLTPASQSASGEKATLNGQQQDQLKAGALEDELNFIVDANEGDNRQLAEAIISRLMVDNLTRPSLLNSAELESELLNIASGEQQLQSIAPEDEQQADRESILASGPSAMETYKLKRLLSLLQNYESNSGAGNQAYNQYPLMPAGQAATMKRAAAKIGNYLQKHPAGYSRSSFDFGLGKRPDTSGINNVLRIGDSSMGGGSAQPVSQFGKRPSAHRYDFGLGKRLASPTYPRYDFGLGKRAPSRVRYDFGLGKK